MSEAVHSDPGASDPVPVSAMVTVYQRVESALHALARIASCVPRPAEVLVHVDANERAIAARIREACPAAEVIVSEANVGPGGGRNRLMARAAFPIVVSFDDDSWPIDGDYFGRVLRVFERHPDAAVLTAQVVHRGEAPPPLGDGATWIADFSGGACAYRRQAFLDTGGYVPLPTAYGMEEVDLAIRLRARGARILSSQALRVYHDSDLAHHASAAVTAASLANIVLLAFLRYPIVLWPIAAGQLANRLQWLLRHGRRRGVLRGLLDAPGHAFRHRAARSTVTAAVILDYLALRRRPKTVC